MSTLPCLFSKSEYLPQVQFPGEVGGEYCRVFSLWFLVPLPHRVEDMPGGPALSPREKGWLGVRSQQVCGGGRDLCSSIRPPP